MSGDLAGIVKRFAGIRALVLGESMLDGYLSGEANRMCPEGPAPVVLVRERKYAAGGAANTAANLKALGATVRLVSLIGDDRVGEDLRALLERDSISTENIIVEKGRRTASKERLSAGSQIIVRIDCEESAPIREAVERELVRRLYDLAAECDVIIVSDYGKGVLTDGVISALQDDQKRRKGLLLVDAKDLTRYRATCPTAITPNFDQAVELMGLEGCWDDRVELALAHGGRLLDMTGARIAAVTIDSDGALIFERGLPPHRTYAPSIADAHPAGAGDTFLGAFALALAAGAGTTESAELASAAAAVVVSKTGTAVCSAAELTAHFTCHVKHTPDPSVLELSLAYERQQGRTIVFTNGCFDIIHAGHAAYLSRAKSLGDVLVVGLNSDESVRRLKGARRPINRLEDRVQVLSALSCIDYIVDFGDDTPLELIRRIRPDVFAKGGDYSRETLPEADAVEQYGGRVEILPYLEDRSTTGIIDQIRRTALAGVHTK